MRLARSVTGIGALVRRVCWAIVCLASIALTTACARDDGARTTLRFWAMGREGEVVAQLLPAFEREHPNIRVVVQQLPWTSAHEKLLTAFAGDATPDVCQLGNSWIPEFVALGALAPLDGHLASSSAVKRSDYFAGVWAANIVGEHTWGVPWYVDTRVFFYRRDLLAAAGIAAPPATWDELLAAFRAIKSAVGDDRYAILLPVNEFEPLVALALQQDEPLLRDGNRHGNFRSPAFRRTLSYYVDMFKERLAPPLSNAEVSNVWTEFGRGYYAFYLSGPWNIAEFRRRLPPEQLANLSTMALPGPDGPGASIAGGSSLVVFKRSANREAAWQLVEYLSQPDVQQRFRALTADLPPRRSAWDDPALRDDPLTAAFREQLERARPTPPVPEWERIATEMRVVSEMVVRGEMTIDEGLAALDARTDRILEKRRWMLDRGARS